MIYIKLLYSLVTHNIQSYIQIHSKIIKFVLLRIKSKFVKMELGIKEVKRYVHNNAIPKREKILMVASSPAVSEQTGWPIGFWASELTAPLLVFQEAGYEVELASTQGGKIEMDAPSNPLDESGWSAHDALTLGFMQMDWFNQLLAKTHKISEIDSNQYEAIFLVGGAGPMYTFRDNPDLQSLFSDFYESGKPTATLCHGSAILLDVKKSDNNLIVEGKTWTGFTDAEEQVTEQSVGQKVQPYWIEAEANKLSNTMFKSATLFSAHAIADGNLITGQQQNSGTVTARLVVEQLSKRVE